MNIEEINISSLPEITQDKNINLNSEEKEAKKIELTPIPVEEITTSKNPEKLEDVKNSDIQNMKSIIKNELYEKELDSNLSEGEYSDDELSDNETRIENMRFRKSGLENLELETLDSDFEIDDGELVNFKPVKVQDISFEKNETLKVFEILKELNPKYNNLSIDFIKKDIIHIKNNH